MPRAVEPISVAELVEELADRPLEELQRDVAGEPVGHDDVGRAAEQVARLGVPEEVEPARREQRRAPRASAGCPSPAPRRSRAGAPPGSRLRGSPRRTPSPCARTGRGARARLSAFAPESMRTDGRNRAGITTAIAGRRTPGSRRMWSSPAASIAPVFPAETTASASPAPTARHAATRLESGFARTASAGFSCIAISSVASTSSRPWASSPAGRRGRRRFPRATPRAPRDHLGRAAVAAQGVDALSRATTEPVRSAARRHGPCTSCSSGRRDAAASAGGRPGIRSRAALRGDASPGACLGVTSTFSSSGLPSAATV